MKKVECWWWLPFIAVGAWFYAWDMASAAWVNSSATNLNNMWQGAASESWNSWWSWAGYALLAWAFCWIWAQNYEGKGWKEGFRYGVLMAFLLIAAKVWMYGQMNMTFSAAWVWIAALAVQGIGAGIILSWAWGWHAKRSSCEAS